jgi:hypothetical protein
VGERKREREKERERGGFALLHYPLQKRKKGFGKTLTPEKVSRGTGEEKGPIGFAYSKDIIL